MRRRTRGTDAIDHDAIKWLLFVDFRLQTKFKFKSFRFRFKENIKQKFLKLALFAEEKITLSLDHNVDEVIDLDQNETFKMFS